MIAIAGESLSASLKLLKVPPESIKSETNVPTAPEGTPMLEVVIVSAGIADTSRVGRAASIEIN